MAKSSRLPGLPVNRAYNPVAMVLLGAGLVLLGLVAIRLIPALFAQIESGQAAGVGLLGAPAQVNYPAPILELTDLQGNPVSLSQYKGKVVLVNNWATWCPPCEAEMPELQSYYQDNLNKNFTIIAIEAGDPLAEVVAFVNRYGLTFPVWQDPQLKAVAAFRNSGLPSSYVIDQYGKIRLVWTGPVRYDMLEKYVTPLLED
jgi:peroxiredoxin